MSDYEDKTEEDLIIPNKALFKKREPARVNDVDGIYNNNKLYYAVTVNIQPTKLMNKKQWRKYTHDEQRSQLLRIEASFRKKTPSVELIEIQFEICPTLNNIHFHAMYYMPKIFIHEVYLHYRRICNSTDDKTIKEWRFIDIQELKRQEDIENWLMYIRKDIDIK